MVVGRLSFTINHDSFSSLATWGEVEGENDVDLVWARAGGGHKGQRRGRAVCVKADRTNAKPVVTNVGRADNDVPIVCFCNAWRSVLRHIAT